MNDVVLGALTSTGGAVAGAVLTFLRDRWAQERKEAREELAYERSLAEAAAQRARETEARWFERRQEVYLTAMRNARKLTEALQHRDTILSLDLGDDDVTDLDEAVDDAEADFGVVMDEMHLFATEQVLAVARVVERHAFAATIAHDHGIDPPASKHTKSALKAYGGMRAAIRAQLGLENVAAGTAEGAGEL